MRHRQRWTERIGRGARDAFRLSEWGQRQPWRGEPTVVDGSPLRVGAGGAFGRVRRRGAYARRVEGERRAA